MNWLLDTINILISPITEVVKGYQERKTLEVQQVESEKTRQHELNLKKVDIAFELAKQGQQVEADWDTNAQQDMKTSWKDEYILILFSLPLILAFIPSMQDVVLKGFQTLDRTPDWYMFLVTGIVCGVYGLRWYVSRNK